MSTELKTSSKAYTLTRFNINPQRSKHGVAVVVSVAASPRSYQSPYIYVTVEDIRDAFRDDAWGFLAPLGLLEETVERLKLDLARFSLTLGTGMEVF